MTQIVDRLRQIVRDTATLCLDVEDPRSENARGYLFDADSDTLYFPVSRKYIEDRDLSRYQVLIWSQPRLVITGRLSIAASAEDTELQRMLASANGWAAEEIDYMLFDQRYRKPRKNRHKLVIGTLHEIAAR